MTVVMYNWSMNNIGNICLLIESFKNLQTEEHFCKTT